jgi:hypothetical protein
MLQYFTVHKLESEAIFMPKFHVVKSWYSYKIDIQYSRVEYRFKKLDPDPDPQLWFSCNHMQDVPASVVMKRIEYFIRISPLFCALNINSVICVNF